MTSARLMGIDVGGTTARAALVHPNGSIIESQRTPTPGSLEALIDWIEIRVRGWTEPQSLRIPIGLALPGVVDPATGVCVRCVNLPWLEGRSFADQLERRIGHRPTLLTDAQATTWGEYFACGMPDGCFGHLRLGTGVACGIVCDGRLLASDPMRKTHWPVLVVDSSASAPECPCGLRGCLENFAGGRALTEQSRSLGVANLFELKALVETRRDAANLLDQASRWVTVAIENLERQFAIEALVLGGGVVTCLPVLLRLIQDRCASLGMDVREARLGDDAGLVGAAMAAQGACLSGEKLVN